MVPIVGLVSHFASADDQVNKMSIRTGILREDFERGRHLLLSHGWSGVCGWVGELLAVADDGERERRRSATDKLLRYFTGQVGRLDYRERLAAGRAIGSGA
ncbi:MAG: hypothetical protein NZO58_11430, partial [Gemmataceae bacterium]|nr:hypothetical protein [Gemmataceae bacterium]